MHITIILTELFRYQNIGRRCIKESVRLKMFGHRMIDVP